jgi:DNA mismatch repair protein MutL
MTAPQVAFRLECDGRVVFEAPAQSQAQRAAALLGSEAAAVLLPVAEERGGLALSGYVCAPSVTRATAAAQILVVNNRPVADPVLRTAVRVAYRDVIAAGRNPVVALFLAVPPDELDVNVHPTKAELQFRDPAAVRGLVIGTVRRVLGGGTGPIVAMPSLAAAIGVPLGTQVGTEAAPMGAASAAGTAFPLPPHPPRPGPAWTHPARPSYPRPPLRLTPSAAARGQLAEAQLPFQAAPAARQIEPGTPSPEHPLGAPVAQVLDTYIIAVAADGSLVLVDQHAAHERLTHESLRAQMLAGGVRSQPLLMPAVVDLPAADVARLVARADDLAQLGLELEEFGAGAILVRAIPAALGAPEPAPLLRDLADELAEMGEQTVLSARLDAILARLACHGSIRAGRRLGPAEMSALLRQMEATPRAATCSHGRPTVLKLAKADIEALFGRR